ncbi:protein of unknown function [Rhizobiales bacterium GAS191]|nr:protein of unknown function [Rhizobiales bacterium GAS191]
MPTGFVSAVNYVASYFDSLFPSNVFVTIDVGYGEVQGRTLPSNALGASLPAANGIAGNGFLESYSSVRNALVAQNAPGANTLPASAPAGAPANLLMTQAEAKALGLTFGGGLDGYVGFSAVPNIFSYGINVTPPSNEYYFVGVVEHEFSEIMGRISGLNLSNAYTPMDLFRYAGAGARQFTTGANSYFSIDGGQTSLDSWNNFQTGNSGDLGDWAPSAGNDALNDNSRPGVINAFSSTDITLMNAIGWSNRPPLQVMLAPGSNSGVPGGTITDVTTPVIVGTGLVGATIFLFVDGGASKSTTVAADGTWSIALGPLSFGGHSLVATEAASGTSVLPVSLTLTIADTIGNAGDYFNLGNSGQTVFVRGGTGQLQAWEFAGGQAVGAAGFTNAGAAFNVDAATTVVGGGQDFFNLGGPGERAVFLRSGSGQLQAWEFDSLNQATGAAGFTNAGAAFTIDAATATVGGGEDFFGLGIGERTVFLRAGSGQLQAWEFNSANQATGAAGFTDAGAAFTIDSATSVIGGGQDFFGLGFGQHTAFLRTGNGQLQAWEFNGLNQATGAAGFTNVGAAFTVDSATTIVGGGQDYFGLGAGERTVFMRAGNGQLEAWEFNRLNQATGAAAFSGAIDTATTVVGAGEDVLGSGQRDIFARDGSGQLFLWQFNASHQLTGYAALKDANGAAIVIDTATTVAGAAIDPASGLHEIALVDGSGNAVWWDFNGTSLINPHGGVSAFAMTSFSDQGQASTSTDAGAGSASNASADATASQSGASVADADSAGTFTLSHAVVSTLQSDLPGTSATEIGLLYETLLHHAPVPTGLAALTAEIMVGAGLTDVANDILGSAEYQSQFGGLDNSQFVSQLFEGALGHPADAAGLQSWTDALAHGETRADVAVGIAESQETRDHFSPAGDTIFRIV